MREKIARFMRGRYGHDELNRFLASASLVCAILSMFVFKRLLYTVFEVSWIIIVIRMLSKNYAARQSENRLFLSLKGRFLHRLEGNPIKHKGSSGVKRSGSRQESDKKIFTCPGCKQKVRVPKGKGTIMITCPRCGDQFRKRT